MAVWLKQCAIRTIALQSTGVYWIAVYDILEEAGFEVYLVNAKETKNLPGRKSDVQESQWLMKLHTYGMLWNSFRPSQEIRTMRTYWRQRHDLVRAAGRYIQRMQKTLTQMNIQLANVLSDVSGMTGQAIVKAILAGERDPYQLAALRNWRVKASEEEIARSLEGNWQEELLFVLQQEQDGYEFCQRQMAECDQRLQQYLQQLEDRSHGAGLPEEKRKERLRKKKKGNAPQFDLRAELFRMTGTDLTQIDGIDVTTTMTILSEAGWDMSKWKTEHHFVSWLRLCPDNRISGDKIIGKGRLPTNNRVTNALRMAASTLRLSNTYLGAQFRRLRTKLGAPVAIKAMAAKLARLVYPLPWDSSGIRILAICFLLAYPLRSDLRCVPDPQLKLQFRKQAFKPASMPTRFHSHVHLPFLCHEITVELIRFFAMLQPPLLHFPISISTMQFVGSPGRNPLL